MKMPEQKLSRKALKTKKLIRNALAEFMKNKALKDITVQEIADKAEISRTTFYNYYFDVYDIYEQLEKEVLSELALLTLKFHEDTSADFGSELLDYIIQNPEVFSMIFSPHVTGELRCKFTSMIEGVFRLIQTEKHSVDLKNIELDYLSAFWSSGCTAVIDRWVNNGFSPSKEYIIKNLAELNSCFEKMITSHFD